MTSLLVPVQLDALMVRADDQPWTLTRLDDPDPRHGRRHRQDLLPAPFQALDPPRPPGAYLHWALPDGLTRARPDAGGTPRFPAVPDRWLVLRLSGPVPRTVRAWLIPDLNAAAPAPIDPLAGDPLPAPDATPELPLTAAGTGDLAWAGYFDNVRDRLALYDPLTDVPPGPIAYLVCGWYTDPALDPVTAPSATASALALADLGWTYDPAELPTGTGFPTASVYLGSAVAIGWPEPHWAGDGGLLGAEPDARPAAGAVSLAVGETLEEALATLTATDGSPALARLYEGLFAGALATLDRPDGPARLDTDLHTRRFTASPSANGEEWIWAPAPARPSPPPATPPADGVGDLAGAIAASAGDTGADDPADAFRKVQTSQPRVWQAVAPEIVVSGGGRGYRHGGDARFTETGTLTCRIEGATVTAFGVVGGDPGAGADVLPPLPDLTAYGVPTALPALLVELASLDPGSAPDLAASTDTTPSPVAAARANWWSIRDPAVPPEQATAGAAISGTLPAPLAVTPPGVPWNPLHLDWAADYLPFRRLAHDWQLGDVDFVLPATYEVPAADPGHPLSGRIPLTSAPVAVLAGAGDDPTAVPDADLLSGALSDMAAQLRKDPVGAVVRPTDGSAPEGDPPTGARPAGSIALRSGFLRLQRLRLVDGYGRFLDLPLGNVPLATGPNVLAHGNPGLIALKPRFTAPARVLLRYAAANGDQVDADAGVSPLCGFVVPSPLDGTLEFFDENGTRLGRLRPDEVTATAWEEDPGQPASYGGRPSDLAPNRFLAAFADALLSADVAAGPGSQSALSALVRIMDATRWTVDATGRSGDDHLALLLAAPVAVLRATILLDVQDPYEPAENARTAVPVKLGALAHQQDGLLAYVVGDDVSRVRVVDPAVAGVAGITSSYVDTSDEFQLYPGTPVSLLLFVVPQTDVHVTTGLLPQKAVGMLREWLSPALAKLSPALRFGPVLRDPKVARVPVPSDVRGNWTWHHRSDPTSWTSEEIVAATGDALLPDTSQAVQHGWLSVTLIPDTAYKQTAVQRRVTHVRREPDGLETRPSGRAGASADTDSPSTSYCGIGIPAGGSRRS